MPYRIERKELKMLMAGQVLYGFCGGYFGRDSYGEKRIEAVGWDWVVVREEDNTPKFASTEDHSWIYDVLQEYLKPEPEELA